jgi:hypothetical protein
MQSNKQMAGIGMLSQDVTMGKYVVCMAQDLRDVSVDLQ